MSASLGHEVARHPGSFAAGGVSWYVGGLLVLSSLVGGGRAVIALVGGEGSIIELAGTGAAALVIGLLLLIIPVTRWRQEVVVYEHGLEHRRLFGQRAITRDEVRAVQRTTHRSRSGSYEEIELTLSDGGSYDITGIARAEQLANLIAGWSRGPGAGVAAAAAPGGWAPGGWQPPTSEESRR